MQRGLLQRACSWLAAILLVVPGMAYAQEATIMGTVYDEDGEPLPGVNVVIEEFQVGGASDVDGHYNFTVPESEVQGQEVEVMANAVGFEGQTQSLTLTPGTHELDFTLRVDVLRLEDVVVTGVADETPRSRLPFSVSRVESDQLDIAPPQSGVVGSLAGRIAGARVVQSSGNPRGEANILLRGATSISRGNDPLIVVDGVIMTSSTVDLNSLDVESIEIVKGAAAASMYGSRAQSGVIQITTNRGANVSLGQTRVRFRNELSVNQVPRPITLNQSHPYRMDSQGNYLDADGNPVESIWDAAVDDSRGVAFYDKEFAGETYDQVRRLLNENPSYRNHVSVAHNTATSNYYASFTNRQDQGVIRGIEGVNAQNVRLNVDQEAGDMLELSLSLGYTQSSSDDPQAQAGGRNPFYDVMFFPANIDLMARNEDGNLIAAPNPNLLQDNPMYVLENRDQVYERRRVIGSARARFRPVQWFDLEGELGYDRGNRNSEVYYPQGFETLEPSSLRDGYLSQSHIISNGLNASLTASFRYSVGDFVGRTRFRAMRESSDYQSTSASTSNFRIPGLRRLGIGDSPEDQSTSSYVNEVHNLGYFVISDFSFRDRYLMDFTVRRDGSSLFGEDQRWHTYGRLSLAYRMAEEPWWPLEGTVDEFRLRASHGTAGNRPSFADQYETFSIGSASVSKSQLGNPDLKPELATEQEYGLNMSLYNRFNFELTYARTTIEDQILSVPLQAFAGYSSQILNAGTVESNTIEMELNTVLLSQPQHQLTASLIFDRTRQEIIEFNRPGYSVSSSGVSIFRNAEGESFGNMYGTRFATSLDDLPDHMQQHSDAFQVNDDGYLVAVGSGNSWRDGLANNLWGTEVEIDGERYAWGMPITAVDEDGNEITQGLMGNSEPSFNIGFSTDYRWRGLSLGMLWQAEVGFDVYNHTKQWAYRDNFYGDQDQRGKSDATKKPRDYYQALYNTNQPSSHFVEDGTYLKLRELSIGYSLDQNRLNQWFGLDVLNRVSFSVVGRNLLTFSGYTGFDPEVGGTLRRVDSFGYPQFRTITGQIMIEL